MAQNKDQVITREQVLAEVGESSANALATARQIARDCKPILEKTAVQISRKKYVQVEGWQTIANAHGCVLSSRGVERVENGWKAIGEVRRLRDGMVVAMAEGFLGDDENTWKNRPEYAKRAMAQTRAMSRAGRSAFAYVLVMMDSDFATTPYEEMMEESESRGSAMTTQTSAAETDKDKARDLAFQAEDKGKIDYNTYQSWLEKIDSASKDTLPAMIRALTALVNKR